MSTQDSRPAARRSRGRTVTASRRSTVRQLAGSRSSERRRRGPIRRARARRGCAPRPRRADRAVSKSKGLPERALRSVLCRCLLRLVGVVDDDVAAPKRNGCKDRHAPRIKKLKENNVRKGFFERDQYEAVRRHLPEYARPVVTFAYITGWRVRSEVLPLQWRQVDFKAGTIRP